MRKTLVSVAIALSSVMTLNAINPNVLVPIPLTVQIVKKVEQLILSPSPLHFLLKRQRPVSTTTHYIYMMWTTT